MSRTSRLVLGLIGAVVAAVLGTYSYFWLTYPAARELAVMPEDVLQPDNNCGGLAGWRVTSTAGGGRVAYRGMRDRDGRKRCYVSVDGQPGPEFDAVGLPFFSPDGRRLAYGAEDAGVAFVVVDGARGPSFGQVDLASLSFSPDGSRLAYSARDTSNSPWSLATDHTRGRAFERVGRAVFSSDGRRVAHWASRREETWTGGRQDIRFHQFVVVDGEPGPEFAEVGEPAFSPDGSTVAYCAGAPGERYLIVGSERRKVISCRHPAFGADGTLAFIEDDPTQKDGTFVRVGDRRGPGFRNIHGFTLSPDGRRIAHYANLQGGADERCAVVVDGVILKEAERCLFGPVFSPDSRHVAYFLRQRIEYLGVDDKIRPAADNIGPPFFSADGRKVGFLALEGRRILWREMSVP